MKQGKRDPVILTSCSSMTFISLTLLIKDFKRDDVTRALHHVEGLSGASFSDVLGFGRGKRGSSAHVPNADP